MPGTYDQNVSQEWAGANQGRNDPMDSAWGGFGQEEQNANAPFLQARQNMGYADGGEVEDNEPDGDEDDAPAAGGGDDAAPDFAGGGAQQPQAPQQGQGAPPSGQTPQPVMKGLQNLDRLIHQLLAYGMVKHGIAGQPDPGVSPGPGQLPPVVQHQQMEQQAAQVAQAAPQQGAPDQGSPDQGGQDQGQQDQQPQGYYRGGSIRGFADGGDIGPDDDLGAAMEDAGRRKREERGSNDETAGGSRDDMQEQPINEMAPQPRQAPDMGADAPGGGLSFDQGTDDLSQPMRRGGENLVRGVQNYAADFTGGQRQPYVPGQGGNAGSAGGAEDNSSSNEPGVGSQDFGSPPTDFMSAAKQAGQALNPHTAGETLNAVPWSDMVSGLGQKFMKYLTGADAVGEKVKGALENKVDNPGAMDPNKRALQAVKYATDTQGKEAGFATLQAYRKTYDASRAWAAHALKEGNIQSAVEGTNKMLATMPGTSSAIVRQNGQGVDVIVQRPGQDTRTYTMSPDQLKALVSGPGGSFDHMAFGGMDVVLAAHGGQRSNQVPGQPAQGQDQMAPGHWGRMGVTKDEYDMVLERYPQGINVVRGGNGGGQDNPTGAARSDALQKIVQQKRAGEAATNLQKLKNEGGEERGSRAAETRGQYGERIQQVRQEGAARVMDTHMQGNLQVELARQASADSSGKLKANAEVARELVKQSVNNGSTFDDIAPRLKALGFNLGQGQSAPAAGAAGPARQAAPQTGGGAGQPRELRKKDTGEIYLQYPDGRLVKKQ